MDVKAADDSPPSSLCLQYDASNLANSTQGSASSPATPDKHNEAEDKASTQKSLVATPITSARMMKESVDGMMESKIKALENRLGSSGVTTLGFGSGALTPTRPPAAPLPNAESKARRELMIAPSTSKAHSLATDDVQRPSIPSTENSGLGQNTKSVLSELPGDSLVQAGQPTAVPFMSVEASPAFDGAELIELDDSSGDEDVDLNDEGQGDGFGNNGIPSSTAQLQSGGSQLMSPQAGTANSKLPMAGQNAASGRPKKRKSSSHPSIENEGLSLPKRPRGMSNASSIEQESPLRQEAKSNNTITSYFPLIDESSHLSTASIGGSGINAPGPGSPQHAAASPSSRRVDVPSNPRQAIAKNAGVQTDAGMVVGIDEFNAMAEAAKTASRQQEVLQADLDVQHRQMQDAQQQSSSYATKARAALIDALRQATNLERATNRGKLAVDMTRLGRPIIQRRGATVTEGFEEGSAFRELRLKFDALHTAKEELEKAKRAAAKERRSQRPASDDCTTMPPPMEVTLSEQDEIWKLQALSLKREESLLQDEKQKLDRERIIHFRDYIRFQKESMSAWRRCPILADRYLLLSMLGKGGFSEVYKAFDLVELRGVACKIHELNPHWTEEKKLNYMRHTTRESQIQKALDHPRVVKLYDVFELSGDSFCTILELCSGEDLDQVLATSETLPEREARSICVQVVAALRYLHMQRCPIIHYDLKPANVLIDRGEVKITDFGLSKIMTEQEAEAGAMELTSQGAGTYWYLPPECFELGRKAQVSTKVDVWSVGVIFYQMLYGCKPFGDGMSQSKILAEGTMNRATNVNFPSQPRVSSEAKEFIRKCLEYQPHRRPDVTELYSDPYIRSSTSKRGPKTTAASVMAPSVPGTSSSSGSGSSH